MPLQHFIYNQKALKIKNERLKKSLLKKSELLLKKKSLLSKKNFLYWKEYARILLHQKQFTKALKAYNKGLKLAPKDKKHYFYNGLANVNKYIADFHPLTKKYYLKALNLYHKAIETSSRLNGLYWSNLSCVYAKLNKWDQAIKSAQKAIKLLQKEEKMGIKHGNQIKILELEKKLYKEYKERTLPKERVS